MVTAEAGMLPAMAHPEPDERTAALAAARLLLGLLKDHEVDMAASIEATVFPHGAPVPLTFAAVLKAHATTLSETTHALVETDIELSRMKESIHADPRRTSLVSQPVAERVAQSE